MNAANFFLKFFSRLMGRTPASSAIFRSQKGEHAFKSAYESALGLWPLPHESVYVPSRFGKTHVIVSGNPQGKPLVLLHGVLAGATMWFPQVNILGLDYHLHAVDILGDVNLSIPTHLPRNRAETAEWLTAVLDGLGVERASIMGISLGGFLALNLALHAPQRVSQLVVLDPAASLASYSLPFMLRMFPNALIAFFSKYPMKSIVKWTTANGQTIEQAEPVLRQMESALKCGQMSLRSLPSVFRDHELQQIQAPVLLLMGTKAIMYNAQVAAQRARSLMKNVSVEFIPDTGHLLTLERPEAVNERIYHFLWKNP